MKLGPLDASGSDIPGTTPGPGQGQERDARLDGEVARVTPRVDLPDVAEHPDVEGVDAAIAEGRDDLAILVRERQACATMTTVPAMPAVVACATCGGVGWVPSLGGGSGLGFGGPGVLGYAVCPGCGGERVSGR